MMNKLSDKSCRIRDSLFAQYLARANGILHLGAHLGQEADLYAKYNKPVIWIEARPDIYARLKKKLEHFPNQCAFCALLGDRDGGRSTFYISNNDDGVSSSIFQFGAYGQGEKSLWPELDLHMVESITLPMARLDTLFTSQGINAEAYDFWVVDLQGAEMNALNGAKDVFNKCRSLFIEISMKEVYKNGILWDELKKWLENEGLEPLWLPELPHDDVLFVRSELSEKEALATFHSEHYKFHNQKRLEHLASLNLPINNSKVLEVGAGIGDHTEFYIERGCKVTVTDIRLENLNLLKNRFINNKNIEVSFLDLENPESLDERYEIIHCYGVLYHLKEPKNALMFLASNCKNFLLLETCVSYGNDASINNIPEPSFNYSQSYYGYGCRPTRKWVWDTLNAYFPFVYTTKSQPNHNEFPIDWTNKIINNTHLYRSIFIGSNINMDSNIELISELPNMQTRYRN